MEFGELCKDFEDACALEVVATCEVVGPLSIAHVGYLNKVLDVASVSARESEEEIPH